MPSLVRLGERMVVSDARPVVPEPAKVSLRSLLLLNGHSDDLHLVVRQSDLNLKLVWHHKLICLDRVIVVLRLLLNLVPFLLGHLLLHLLLLDLLHIKDSFSKRIPRNALLLRALHH